MLTVAGEEGGRGGGGGVAREDAGGAAWIVGRGAARVLPHMGDWAA